MSVGLHLEQYTKGPRKGEHCVWKVFKSGSVYEKKFFREDIKAVDKAAEIIEAFLLAAIRHEAGCYMLIVVPLPPAEMHHHLV